jgi:hypothetical protein
VSTPMLLRSITPRDVALITHSWLSNYRKSWHVKGVSNDVYYGWHHRVLEELLPRATTIVACDPSDLDTVYGWVCAEVIDDLLVIHYVYVKSLVKALEGPGGKRKGWGVGSMLIKELVKYNPNCRGIIYTHETAAGRDFMRRLWEKGDLPHEPLYHPYYLYSSLTPGWAA